MATRAEIDAEYHESLDKMRALAADGLTAGEIAKSLHINVRTIRGRADRNGIELAAAMVDGVYYRPCTCRLDKPSSCHSVDSRKLGHRYSPDLDCMWCGATWEAQQKNPTACTEQRRMSEPEGIEEDGPSGGMEQWGKFGEGE